MFRKKPHLLLVLPQQLADQKIVRAVITHFSGKAAGFANGVD
jgi:hypothetical protein